MDTTKSYSWISNQKIINPHNLFKNKKVAVLGLGIEGEDVIKFLLRSGAVDITAFDRKAAGELGQVYQNLKSPFGPSSRRGQILNFKLGVDYLKDDLVGFDVIFRSPAFKLSLPEIVEAKKHGVVISSVTKLFFDLCPAKIIGVTGTKGKGTTATLIYEILKAAKKKVFLAGNIGQPMLALLPKLSKKDRVVLELSSFQLQDMDKSPHIAVALFITSEHLDYHKNTQEYIRAKSRIVRYQGKKDFSVLNFDNLTSRSFTQLTKAKVYYFSREREVKGAYIKNEKIYLLNDLIGGVDEVGLRGRHNLDNICAAAMASHLAGADLVSIKKIVKSFSGLEHRLEFVRNYQGVSFYNDSFSTVPETTIAAIQSFKEPIILIAGGSEKGSDFTELGKEIARSSIKALILIGKMASRIRNACIAAGYHRRIIWKPKNMGEIVRLAFQTAIPGDVVLLSPACASFDMFRDYKDRGEQFKKYVQTLKEECHS